MSADSNPPEPAPSDPDVARLRRIYDLRVEHGKATRLLAISVPLALLFGGVTLVKMTSPAPVTDFEAQAFWMWVALTVTAGVGWRSGRRRRAVCRPLLAELDALPSGPALAVPAVSAAIGAVGAVVVAFVTTLVNGR